MMAVRLPTIEPSDTKREMAMELKVVMAPIKKVNGEMMSSAPAPVSTPRPPLNPIKMG